MMSKARKLSVRERAIVDRLLEGNFPGVTELRGQLETARVREIDDDGCLEFVDVLGETAPVERRVVTEGEAVDRDGVVIHILLHVVDGKLDELEVYKEDGSVPTEPIPAGAVQRLED